MNNKTSFKPPIEVQMNAKRALETRAKLPPSQRAMTPVGIARARDLANGRPQSLETIQRMKSFFARHAVDKQSANYGVGSKGWQAWMGWGGDAGRRWVDRILAESNINDPVTKKSIPATPAPIPVIAITSPQPISQAEEVAEPAGGMAIGQLKSLSSKAAQLATMLTPDMTLEPWVASLLSVAEYQISEVYDYLTFSAKTTGTQKGDGMQKTFLQKSDIIQKSLTVAKAQKTLGGNTRSDQKNEESVDFEQQKFLEMTAEMENTAMFFTSFEKADRDQRLVVGYASSERIDGQNDIVDSNALHNALEDYMKWANLREMHQPKAVGKVVSAVPIKGNIRLSDGTVLVNPLRIIAKIVDEDAWQKVKSGVLKGFSIGGKVLNAITQKVNGESIRRITGLVLNEISLVDRPANPDARIVMMKRADDVLNTKSIAKMVKNNQVDTLIRKAKEANPAEILPMIQQLRNQAEVDGDLDTAERYNEVITLMLEAMGVIPTGTVREIDEQEEPANYADFDGADDMADMEALYGQHGGGDETAAKRQHSFMYADNPVDLIKVGRAISKANMTVLADIARAAEIITMLCKKLGLEMQAGEKFEGDSEMPAEGSAVISISTDEPVEESDIPTSDDEIVESFANAPRKMMPGNNTGSAYHTPMNPNAPAQNVKGGYPIQMSAQNKDLQKASQDVTAVDIIQLEKEMQSMEETIENANPVTDVDTIEGGNETTAKAESSAPTIDVSAALQDVIAKSLTAALASQAAQLETVAKAMERIDARASEQVEATKLIIEPLAKEVQSLTERLANLENQPVASNAPVLRGQSVSKAIGIDGGGEPAQDEVAVLKKMIDDTQNPMVRTQLRERLAHLESRRVLFGR